MHNDHPSEIVASMAFFGERGAEIIENAVGFIQDMEVQTVNDFALDIAVDRQEYADRLTELFSVHASTMLNRGQVVFTSVEDQRLPGGIVDNKNVAWYRVGKYMKHKQAAQVKTLVMVDPDRYPENYIQSMHEGLSNTGAPIVIADQWAFQAGDDEYLDNCRPIQSSHFSVGHKSQFGEIINFDITAFCNMAINLSSDFVYADDYKILQQATYYYTGIYPLI